MPDAAPLFDALAHLWPLLVTLGLVAAALMATRWYFEKRAARLGTHNNFSRPVATLVVLAVSLIAVILSLPLNDGTKDQLLGILGLVLTGIIGLSSTTIISNAMGGLMIRSIGSFRSGDFVKIGDHFGRVSARGLFHTEIQTEERDLTTLPNLFLITNPVTVVRSSGTILSATVSLGYDVHHATVEPLLLEAARNTGLADPFVRVMALGDFSVTYRVAGLLEEVKLLVSKRSELNGQVLNVLHGAGIEILSPTAMMQRPLHDGQRILPADRSPSPVANQDARPEARIFDKAEEAEEMEKLLLDRDALRARFDALEKELSDLDEPARAEAESQLARWKTEIEDLEARHESYLQRTNPPKEA